MVSPHPDPSHSSPAVWACVTPNLSSSKARPSEEHWPGIRELRHCVTDLRLWELLWVLRWSCGWSSTSFTQHGRIRVMSARWKQQHYFITYLTQQQDERGLGMQDDEWTVAQDSRYGRRRCSRSPHRGLYRKLVLKRRISWYLFSWTSFNNTGSALCQHCSINTS